jgi:hypothetical protein
VKKLIRVTVLTLVAVGVLSAAALPKTPVLNPQTGASPIPLCDPWSGGVCH